MKEKILQTILLVLKKSSPLVFLLAVSSVASLAQDPLAPSKGSDIEPPVNVSQPSTEDQLRISRYISRFGETYSTGGIAGILILAGQISHNERLRETGLLGAEALVDSFVVVTGIKMATRRERPFEGDGSGRFWK